ncbi:MAG: PIN domain-containing protein [Gemmatimonadetes bacterium]|nr:PIN domain-containing protein [Gemmatimonadota bacterium]MCH8935009.1 PIN domain-containing protein [Gemmatimonadota bacterium]
MRAIDTNVLVFAEINSSPQHDRALEILRECSEGPMAWAIPWPCVYEFLRVVTHPRVYHPPVPPEVALGDMRAVLASPSLVLLSETPRHADVMDAVVRSSGATGNLIHDAHIAALCLEHGVTELVTGDRDFHRFQGLRVVDPFSG